jgi:hypothetical protein
MTLTCKGTVHYSVSAVAGAQSYLWSFPAGWIGSGTTNTVSAVTGGSGTMSVSASGLCGVSPAKTLSVTVRTCTGINEVAGDDTQLSVFPNPNNGEFELKMNRTGNGNAALKVYDLVGTLVYETEIVNDGLSKKINVAALSNGIYLVHVNSDHQEYTVKVIVGK